MTEEQEAAIRAAARKVEELRMQWEMCRVMNTPTKLEDRIRAAEDYEVKRFRLNEAQRELDALIGPGR